MSDQEAVVPDEIVAENLEYRRGRDQGSEQEDQPVGSIPLLDVAGFGQWSEILPKKLGCGDPLGSDGSIGPGQQEEIEGDI